MNKVCRKHGEQTVINNVLFKFPIKHFALVAAGLPIVSIVICFVTAIIYQFDQVNETVCDVDNAIPSISAVTGVAPQRYLWRFVTAINCSPRLAFGFVYFSYYDGRLECVVSRWQHLYKRLCRLALWLYIIENVTFVSTAYISNVDNYPIHEKLFITFMVSSISYEFICIFLFRLSHPLPMTPKDQYSYKWKVLCFVLIIIFTAGLIFFFILHRVYCVRIAFSCFSFCEYGIMMANIRYHYTGTTDFEDLNWYFARPVTPLTTNNHNGNHHKAE